MQRVFLVGARASGKSTIGRSLAETLGCPFLDTDKELTRDLGCSIDVFVKENGWDAFRRKEHETLKRLAGAGEKKQDGEWLVIATGGGMVLLPENRKGRYVLPGGTCGSSGAASLGGSDVRHAPLTHGKGAARGSCRRRKKPGTTLQGSQPSLRQH